MVTVNVKGIYNMAVSRYKHGVTWRDVPTSIVAPVTADSGIPVATGASPIFQTAGDYYVNKPRVYYSYEEAVSEMGYSDDWVTYGLSGVIYTYFALFNTGPIVLTNVLDPDDPAFQQPERVDDTYTFIKGVCSFISDTIVPKTLVVKDAASSTELAIGC